MIDISQYIALVENYNWSNPDIEYIVILLKIEKRFAVMISNAIRKQGYKVQLSESFAMALFGTNFFNLTVYRKNCFE